MTDFITKFDVERLGLSNHAKKSPDKPALIMNETTITFKELDRMTNTLANAFLQFGIKHGDRISILFHNSPEILIVWGAAGKIGVTPIALNYRFKEDELAHIINDSESKILIYCHEFKYVVNAAKPKFTIPSLISICSGGAVSSDTLNLYKIIGKGLSVPLEIDTGSYSVSSVLIYTSGTTGKPKGVFKTNKNRLNALLGYAHIFESDHDDTHLVAGPLYHAAPYAWASFSLMLGNTLVIMSRFDAERFLRSIEKYQITTTFVVPTMLNRIVNLPEDIIKQYDISSLRVLVMGGESCPFPLKKRVVEFLNKTRIFEFYGGTETGVVTRLRPEDQLRKPRSCGEPVLGSRVKLLDENKNETPSGEVGILYVKSDLLMDGYFKNPKATEESYHNGYLTMGDMARVDDEGYYYIVDRVVDMVVSGGINIYPAEIEEVLYGHPEIYDVAIIGAPDPEWGEKLVAYIVPGKGAGINETDVTDYVERHLASFKKPKEVIFVDELPYSPSGKQLKRVLRDEYTRERTVKDAGK